MDGLIGTNKVGLSPGYNNPLKDNITGYTESVSGKVRDCYLSDLSEDIQKKVMDCHKIITNAVNSTIDEEDIYEDLKNSRWAMSCIDEFKTMPGAKSQVGSVRIFKKGKTYECMIQMTGHFKNHQYGWIEELLHDFIKDVYSTVRPIIRKKFDMTLKNEGEMGNPEEGFDIYPSKKIAEEMWNKLEDRKTKVIRESSENISNDGNNQIYEWSFTKTDRNSKSIPLDKGLPEGLNSLIKDTNVQIIDKIRSSIPEEQWKLKISEESNITAESLLDMLKLDTTGVAGHTYICKNNDGTFYGSTMVTPDINIFIGDVSSEDFDKISNFVSKMYDALNDMFDEFNKENPGKTLQRKDGYSRHSYSGKIEYIEILYDKEYAGRLWLYLDNPKKYPLTEAAGNDSIKEELKNGPIATSEPKVEYNTNMTEAQARKTLATLSKQIIDGGKDHKVTQYTANIYANVITKNLLPRWSKGYKKLIITLDTYQSFNTLEFKVPKMTQDFVARFIDGRETISGFLHRDPVIKIKMSPRIFHLMKNPNDAYNFFKAAIMYYDSGLDRVSVSLMTEIRKLGTEMRELICTTNLSGLVTIPLQMLFVFDDVDMSNKNTFRISKEDIDTVNKFIRNIYTRYAAPEKEKKKIIDDVKGVISSLREQCEMDDNIISLSHFDEAVEDFLYGKYDKKIKDIKDYHIERCVDITATNNPKDPNVKYLQEKFGVKKLKKLPLNIVTYISIEAETIKDANDKLMIASYCLSKIEIVEWYIELLEVGSSKYVVPHNKPYLENLRTQLLACYKKIMETPIPKRDRPLMDIKYPAGYEG